MRESRGIGRIGSVAALLLAVAGCDGQRPGLLDAPAAPPAGDVEVPAPLDLLLPREVRIHSFTGTRTFDQQGGGVRGIDVRVEAIDAFGDSTKAFGEFRFEMYAIGAGGRVGKQLTVWQESVLDVEKNMLHWDPISRAYRFKLQWDRSIPVGRRFLLKAVFISPFTERLFAEREFVSGE